jgi:hypothetical protein
MLENNLYNLMEQMTEENKSLWRIKSSYKQDAKGCGECVTFWDDLARDKEMRIKKLQDLIKTHIEG